MKEGLYFILKWWLEDNEMGKKERESAKQESVQSEMILKMLESGTAKCLGE